MAVLKCRAVSDLENLEVGGACRRQAIDTAIPSPSGACSTEAFALHGRPDALPKQLRNPVRRAWNSAERMLNSSSYQSPDPYAGSSCRRRRALRPVRGIIELISLGLPLGSTTPRVGTSSEPESQFLLPLRRQAAFSTKLFRAVCGAW